MSKIVVITEQGRLVGIWIPSTARADAQALVTQPVAGERQAVHEIDVSDAEIGRDPSAAAELETLVKKKLRLS